MTTESSHYENTKTFHDQAGIERDGFYDWHPGHGSVPDHSRWQKMARRLVLRILTKTIADSDVKSVLDVGCGRGDFTRALAERYPQANVRGVDFSDAMLDLAMENAGPRMEFEKGALPELDMRDGDFDVVVALNVLHHVHGDDQSLAVANICRRSRRVLVVEIKNMSCPYKRLRRGIWLNEETRVFPTTVDCVASVAKREGLILRATLPIFVIGILSPIVVMGFSRE